MRNSISILDFRPELAAMFQCFASGVKGFAIFSSNQKAPGDAADNTSEANFNSSVGRFSPVAIPHSAAATGEAQRGWHVERRVRQPKPGSNPPGELYTDLEELPGRRV
jgi:hypothetical protein